MSRKRITLITILSVGIAILMVAVWVAGRTSLESRVAAIDARRSIPDADNAALLYTKSILLASDPKIALDLCNNIPSLPVHEIESAISQDLTLLVNSPNVNTSLIVFTESQPWQRIEALYMADWLDQRQALFQGLAEASKMPGCFFPLMKSQNRISLPDIPAGRAFRKLAFVLRRAAYYDLGEGRTHEAFDKIETIIRMARHLQQQPTETHLMIGVACESMGIKMMENIIVDGSIQDEDLDDYDALYTHPQTDWWSRGKEIGLGTAWIQRQASDIIPWRIRFQMAWQDLFSPSPYTPASVAFARFDSIRHAQPILVALRRYHNRTGQWPESLNDIESELPREAFIDPQCNGPYVYQPMVTGFRLYSQGANGRDDNGKRTNTGNGPDDIVIWQHGNN